MVQRFRATGRRPHRWITSQDSLSADVSALFVHDDERGSAFRSVALEFNGDDALSRRMGNGLSDARKDHRHLTSSFEDPMKHESGHSRHLEIEHVEKLDGDCNLCWVAEADDVEI